MKEIIRVENLAYTEKNHDVIGCVSFAVPIGAVMGVYTTNTYEKDVLVDLLIGMKKPSYGRIFFDEQQVNLFEADYLHKDVYCVDTSNKVVDDLSVAENIFVLRKNFKGLYTSIRLYVKECQRIFDEAGLGINPKCYGYQLNVVEKKIVEFYKAYILSYKVIVIKNISAILTDVEMDLFFRHIEILKKKGVSFIVVDSYPNIINRVADFSILINKGLCVWTFGEGELAQNSLEMLYASHPQTHYPQIRDASMYKKNSVRIHGLTTEVIQYLSLTIKQGELRMLFDNNGKGITSFLEIFKGDIDYDGIVEINGKSMPKSNVYKAYWEDVALIEDVDPIYSLIQDFTLLDNLCYPVSNEIPDFWMTSSYKDAIHKGYLKYFEAEDLRIYEKEWSKHDALVASYLRWHIKCPPLIICYRPLSTLGREFEDVTLNMLQLLLERGISVLLLTSNYLETILVREHFNINFERMPLFDQRMPIE